MQYGVCYSGMKNEWRDTWKKMKNRRKKIGRKGIMATILCIVIAVGLGTGAIFSYYAELTGQIDVGSILTFDDVEATGLDVSESFGGIQGDSTNFTHYLNSSSDAELDVTFTWSMNISADGVLATLYTWSGSEWEFLVNNTASPNSETYTMSSNEDLKLKTEYDINDYCSDGQYDCVLTITKT